ncbi:hypothetical protein AAZX31_19G178100 [Glycine max]
MLEKKLKKNFKTEIHKKVVEEKQTNRRGKEQKKDGLTWRSRRWLWTVMEGEGGKRGRSQRGGRKKERRGGRKERGRRTNRRRKKHERSEKKMHNIGLKIYTL